MTLHSSVNPSSSREALVEELSAMPLIGEVISWSLLENRGQKNSYVSVINALQKNGLDASVAKEFTPAKAFTRACLKLKENRVIDVLGSNSDEILFQFSQKTESEDTEEGGKEVEYKKEHKILLEKATGKVHCRNPKLKEQAEKELARAMEERTTGDVTNILERLFKVNSDLISIGNGVFFTPEMYSKFNDQIEGFMRDLDRKIVRFPVPKGTAVGDRSVVEVVSKHMKDLIAEMKGAVNAFTPKTRSSTQEALVDKINSTRSRALAYNTILQDASQEILDELDLVNEKLSQKIEEMDQERKNNPDLSTNVAQKMEGILSVVGTAPLTPKAIKLALGWDVSVSINDALVKLVEQSKLVKKDGGYIKP